MWLSQLCFKPTMFYAHLTMNTSCCFNRNYTVIHTGKKFSVDERTNNVKNHSKFASCFTTDFTDDIQNEITSAPLTISTVSNHQYFQKIKSLTLCIHSYRKVSSCNCLKLMLCKKSHAFLDFLQINVFFISLDITNQHSISIV